ncbi:putative mediator of RNA polymerase II transcription subunit 21 [Procambarus clarkii]|uniref:putative mediator of RNA polymerase II transcription subunit 21 n=1 Tax=Procambarus clarkii TaxID=6728 RepID=UPI00374261E9
MVLSPGAPAALKGMLVVMLVATASSASEAQRAQPLHPQQDPHEALAQHQQNLEQQQAQQQAQQEGKTQEVETIQQQTHQERKLQQETQEQQQQQEDRPEQQTQEEVDTRLFITGGSETMVVGNYPMFLVGIFALLVGAAIVASTVVGVSVQDPDRYSDLTTNGIRVPSYDQIADVVRRYLERGTVVYD